MSSSAVSSEFVAMYTSSSIVTVDNTSNCSKAGNKARGIGCMNFHYKLFAGKANADLLLPRQENGTENAKEKILA